MRGLTRYFFWTILATVIGGLILSLLLHFFGVLDFPTIYEFIFESTVPFLFTRVELLVWEIICIFLAGSLFILLCRFLRSKRSASCFLDYSSDKIYGLRWDWDDLISTADRISSLAPRCPRFWCKCQLTKSRLYGPVTFHCQHCGFKKSLQVSYNELLTRVDTEIDRRITTKAYRFKLIKKPLGVLLKLPVVIKRLISRWLSQRSKKTSW